MRPIDADALVADLSKIRESLMCQYDKLRKGSYERVLYYGKFTAINEAIIDIERDVPTLDYVPKWISVKDRLPNTTDVYLVNAVHRYNKNDGYRSPQIRLYFKDDNEWQGLPDLYEVTHWMSLPLPPKGE